MYTYASFRDIYSGHPPKLKNREEFEEGLEKGRGKGGKEEKKKSDKTHVKIPL